MIRSNKNYSVSDILEQIQDVQFECIGDLSSSFSNTCSAEEMDTDSIVWVGHKLIEEFKTEKKVISASIVITDIHPNKILSKIDNCYLVSDKPKLLYLAILNTFFVEKKRAMIHPSSTVHELAEIGDNVFIGPNCYIGKVKIGSDSIIEGNNYIYDNVFIGRKVIIQAGAIIGSKGMSLARKDNGELIGFPSLGKVIIEDHVEVGSNTVIDQSVLSETFIGYGTKINSSSFIGNSVRIGKNNYISVLVNINGSVRIGDENFIGSGSTIRNKIIIGHNNTIGAGTVLVKNIANNVTITGNPGIVNNKANGIKL